MTRMHRVLAFCDWVNSLPPGELFYEHPDFVRFSDLTDGEAMAASIELRRRAEAASNEAAELRAYAANRVCRHTVQVANDDPEPPEAA